MHRQLAHLYIVNTHYNDIHYYYNDIHYYYNDIHYYYNDIHYYYNDIHYYYNDIHYYYNDIHCFNNPNISLIRPPSGPILFGLVRVYCNNSCCIWFQMYKQKQHWINSRTNNLVALTSSWGTQFCTHTEMTRLSQPCDKVVTTMSTLTRLWLPCG